MHTFMALKYTRNLFSKLENEDQLGAYKKHTDKLKAKLKTTSINQQPIDK